MGKNSFIARSRGEPRTMDKKLPIHPSRVWIWAIKTEKYHWEDFQRLWSLGSFLAQLKYVRVLEDILNF